MTVGYRLIPPRSGPGGACWEPIKRPKENDRFESEARLGAPMWDHYGAFWEPIQRPEENDTFESEARLGAPMWDHYRAF